MIDPNRLTDRFIRYAKMDTQSDDSVTDRYPSTDNQLNLSRLLLKELKDMGMVDASMDEHGYVMGTIPSTTSRSVPTIGFLAHVDTSPETPGANVKPRLISAYDGGDIILNQSKGIILSPSQSPELNSYVGQDIIVTDGTTLLGADDKAGVAAIMAAAEVLLGNPDIEHGPVRIAFTLDEEVGQGVDLFDVPKFNATYAYTIDGGTIGELEYENFNAASARVKIVGHNTHPGYAKGKMRNASLIAMEFASMLPPDDRPECTEKYQGFFHLQRFTGAVDGAHLDYIIRDHSFSSFQERKALVSQVAKDINHKYGEGTVTLQITDQYYNMRKQIEPHIEVVNMAIKAMESVGVKPRVKPIRGGTDGARLSYMGLPCPNIFAGGENFHSIYEFLPVSSMVKSAEVILKIVELNTRKDSI